MHGFVGGGPSAGRARAPSCRLIYLLEAGVGPLAVLSFAAAPLQLEPRDRHLGWDARTWRERIRQVVSNDRFALPNWVPSRVPFTEY